MMITLGVDFGTSYTVAALATAPGTPELVRFGDDLRMPSAVALDDTGTLQAGALAVRHGMLAPDRVDRTPKRALGQGLVLLGGRAVRDTELVAAVYRQVAIEARQQLNGSDPDAVVLSHPVRWEKTRLACLREAASLAGWSNITFVPEPVAAAEGLDARGALANVAPAGTIAIYDLGGGTFDTALVERRPEGFLVVGEPGGKDGLGGEQLDDLLLERLSATMSRDDERMWRAPESSADPTRWTQAGFRLRDDVRHAKEDLAHTVSVDIPLTAPFMQARLRLSREDVEHTSTALVQETADVLETTLRRNGKTADSLAAICLAGGSSRLTLVKRVLGRRFGRPIITWADPKALTAEGASLSAQPRALEPTWHLSSRVQELVANIMKTAGTTELRLSLNSLCESLAGQAKHVDPLDAALEDAARAAHALQKLEQIGLRSRDSALVRDQLEQFTDTALDARVIDLARWYMRVAGGGSETLSQFERDELRRLLTASSHVERLGLSEHATTDDVCRAIADRVRSWRSLENAPRASPDAQRLARAVQAFYDLLYGRLKDESVGEPANA